MHTWIQQLDMQSPQDRFLPHAGTAGVVVVNCLVCAAGSQAAHRCACTQGRSLEQAHCREMPVSAGQVRQQSGSAATRCVNGCSKLLWLCYACPVMPSVQQQQQQQQLGLLVLPAMCTLTRPAVKCYMQPAIYFVSLQAAEQTYRSHLSPMPLLPLLLPLHHVGGYYCTQPSGAAAAV
jgi:hypothetical protein